jgi:hypothetical protein
MSIFGLSYCKRKEGRLVFCCVPAAPAYFRLPNGASSLVPWNTYMMTVQSWMPVCLGLGSASAPGTAVVFASQRCLTQTLPYFSIRQLQ